MSPRKAALPVVASKLPAMAEDELEDASQEDLRAEAFLLASTGHTQAQIADRLHRSRATVQKYLRQEAQARRTRAQNVNEELERIAGVYEGVALEAWSAYRGLRGSTSLAGSNYLRLVLDATEKLARLRGVEADSGRGATGKAEIIVRIGGETDTPGRIEIGARAS